MLRRPVRYVLVAASSEKTIEFVNMVNDAIKDGYEPFGNVVLKDLKNNYFQLVQTLVKYEGWD